MSAALYEKLGRLQEQIEQKDIAFNAVLYFVAKMLTGEIELSRIRVDLTNRVVSCSERGQAPALPMQLNGLPECVVQKTPTEADVLRDRVRQLEAELLIASTAQHGAATADPAAMMEPRQG